MRVLVRDPQRVTARPWAERVEVMQGDLLLSDNLAAVCAGMDVIYYLVHSMNVGHDFAELDRRAAERLCQAAVAAGVQHVIYMGGLLPRKLSSTAPRGSEHLRSRAEIGRILARNLPTTEFRAGPIIGSGSASFEMTRYIAERLPVLMAPAWVNNRVQPIAIRDVLTYLILALQRDPAGIVEIGSAPLSYKQMLQEYARVRGLRRWIIPLPPLLPAWFGAGWIRLLTPIPNRIAGPLIDGMRQSLVAREFRARKQFPEVVPMAYPKAVKRALRCIEERSVETRWSDAMRNAGHKKATCECRDAEGMVREIRSLFVSAPAENIVRVVSRLGGENGWLAMNWAWKVRGFMDRLLGGPGLRRGRRHTNQLRIGDTLDFWRVDALVQGQILRLSCEAKIPGHGWLQWELNAEGTGTRLTQTLAFAPHGLRGLFHWYGLQPLRRWVSRRLIGAIGRHALQENTDMAASSHLQEVRQEGGQESGHVLKAAPTVPGGILADMRAFFWHRPAIPTLIKFASPEEREDMSHRVMQRIGVDLTRYSVQNVHRIGIEVPARYVFEELLKWDRNSSCWPNHLATVNRVDGQLSNVMIHPFGRRGSQLSSLFNLNVLRIHTVPSDADPDNARYMLFSCDGGYPVGVFVFYVRSSIAELAEQERSQIFVGVSFDFYGKEKWPLFHPVNRVWESIHNRAMGNILNRFKQVCEWQFERRQAGLLQHH